MGAKNGEKDKRRSIAWIIAVVWMSVITPLSLIKPDSLFALLVWPAWILLLPGLLPLLLKRQPKWILGGVWAVCMAVAAEEPATFARSLTQPEVGALRIVSLNCAGGSLEAAREVIPLKPDIVLLQESPSRPDLEKLRKELFGREGSLVWGPDASILAKGHLEPMNLPKTASNHVVADWSSPAGKELRITSLRLQPPVLRLDLSNPEAWKSFAENRRARRKELDEIMDVQSGNPSDIIGGDFNTPPEKGYVPGLADSFAEQGRGYGATCVNPLPCIVRIDQVWRSSKLRTVNSFVVKTSHSDHRMIVSDFAWSGQ